MYFSRRKNTLKWFRLDRIIVKVAVHWDNKWTIFFFVDLMSIFFENLGQYGKKDLNKFDNKSTKKQKCRFIVSMCRNLNALCESANINKYLKIIKSCYPTHRDIIATYKYIIYV